MLYKKLSTHMKNESISLPKAFISKQEDHEKWVEEEETSEDVDLNVKGHIAFINDSPDSNLNM